MTAKIKSAGKTKKLSSVSVSKVKPTTNSFKSAAVLKNKKMSIGIILIVIVLILLLVLFKSIFIAAMVNGEPISRLSVVTVLEKQGGKTTLSNLIIKKLILQEAKKKNTTVTQNDIDSEIKKISENLKTQGSTLDQALASQGMTISDLNDEIRVQVAINKMVGTDIQVTEKEIDDFVVANKAQMTEGTTDAQFREQATEALKQEQLKIKTQDFIKNLQDKANVIDLVSY